MISAFLTWSSLENFFSKNECSIRNFLFWYAKKAIRILPLYYLSILICIITGHFEAYWIGSIGKITIWNYISHFLFINGFNPYHVACLYGEGYITTIMIWYMVSPFIFRYVDRLDKALLFWLASILGGTVIPKVILRYFPNPLPEADLYIWQSYISVSWIPAQIGVLASGVMFYFVFQGLRAVEKNKLISTGIIFLDVLLSLGLIIGRTNVFGITNITLWGIVALVLCIGLSFYSNPVIDNFILRYLGRHSLEIYIYHFFVILIYNHFFQYESIYAAIVRFCVVITVTAAGALLLDRFYNQPIIKRLNAHLMRLNH